MLDVAIMLEGQDGVNWENWQRFARAAEDLGFAGLFRSDHFTNASGPHKDSLEMWTSFTWLASATKRIEFGPVVSPVSFRNPVVTAWTAAAIDDLSGGRFRLGLGAGWQEREHRSYGFDLLKTGPRFDRFEEALNVVSLLLKSDTKSAFDGKYYHLEEALLLPRPKRAGGPPIVIGGNGPKLTLPLVTKFADEWNAVYVTADRFRDLSGQLDGMLAVAGRDLGSVKRTLMTRVIVGKDEAAALDKVPADRDAEDMRNSGVVIGGPDQIVEALGKLGEAGVSRVMAQWLDLDDMAGIELLASKVLPQLK